MFERERERKERRKRTVGVIADAESAVGTVDVGDGDGDGKVGLRGLKVGPIVGDLSEDREITVACLVCSNSIRNVDESAVSSESERKNEGE